MVRPITPDEAVALRVSETPDAVTEAINAVIAKRWDGRMSHFTQERAMA